MGSKKIIKHLKKSNIALAILIFTIVLFSIVLSSDVYALESWTDDSTTSSLSEWHFFKKLGDGHSTTIESMETKVILDTDSTIYVDNFGISYCSDGTDTCSTPTSAVEFTDPIVTPSACKVDGYDDRLEADVTGCPLDTEVTIYQDGYSFAMDSDDYYYITMSGGNTNYDFSPVGETGSTFYANGTGFGQKCSPYRLTNSNWYPPNSDYYCRETGLYMPYFIINDDYGSPTGSVTADTVDVDDLTIDLTGSGDFGVTGEGYRASLVIQAVCTDPTTDDIYNFGTNVANVSWEADDDITDTFHEGGKYYTGAGYTDTDSTYSFSGVTVPYVRDYNCQYPAYAFIYDGDGNVVYSNIDDENTFGNFGREIFDFNPSNIPDPAITFTTTSPTSSESEPVLEAENDGLFGRFVLWFNEKLINPQVVIDTVSDYHQSITALMSAKSPFGYFMFMQDIDHSVPATTDSIPNWDWQLGDSVYFETGFVSDVAFMPDIQTTLTWIRDNVITRALIIILGIYLISLGKRVFKK